MIDGETQMQQAERHHEERRGWHKEAIDQWAAADKRNRKVTDPLLWALAVRPFIELAILITLIVKL